MRNKLSTKSQKSTAQVKRLFNHLLDYPKLVIVCCLIFIIVISTGLSRVIKDPSVDAFVPLNHPAAVNRELAEAIFGVEDPVIIGLEVPQGETVFTPERLQALVLIDEKVRQIDGVKKNDVISLANQNAILGNYGDLLVEPVIPKGTLSNPDIKAIQLRIEAMPMFKGLLISNNERLFSVIVPVDDPNQSHETVKQIKEETKLLASSLFNVHIAGVAAMNARLASMVDADTKILVPIAFLTVLLILMLALAKPLATAGPLLVIAGSAAVAIGAMGWFDARYYLITTALPVVIMAIAVADSLHLCTYYFEHRSRFLNNNTSKKSVLYAIEMSWIPITLTSITTIAAFIGLSFGAAMKPISEFGYFAAIGVATAWLLSLTLLPAFLIVSKATASTKPATNQRYSSQIEHYILRITKWVFAKPIIALVSVSCLTTFLLFFALQSSFDYERQRYFADSDPIKTADLTINEHLGGINFLDIVVSSPEQGGLMKLSALRNIQNLREQIETLPYVTKVSGIDEYISLMHKVLTNSNQMELPVKEWAPAQYMFLYEASAPPEDFKQEIDFNHQIALIRAQLTTDSYSKTQPTLHQLESLTSKWSQTSGLQAEVSGRVAVNNGWMTELANNHFRGLGLAFSLVFLCTVLMFRSFIFALLASVPALIGVICVYATMGLLAIDIAPATSMTAAIATGLGIDFGIHLIAYIKKQTQADKRGFALFEGYYSLVAKACFYSAIALGIALAVICISSAPPLRWFGMLVAIGAFGSLLGALFVVPAICSISETIKANRRHAHAI